MLSLIENIKICDLTDIVFSAYIIFRFYAILSGTNVLKAIITVIALWIFKQLAFAADLTVTSFVLQGFIAISVFIIIVVFRNEIRMAIQPKEWKGIFWGIPHQKADTPIEIIVASIYEISRKRWGALIIFPGVKNPDSMIQNGLPWRGVVSKEMIMSIFWKNNPVHDGAIVIRGDRIMTVGAILPLTLRENLPGYYGTRHRAALGLAENSDSLIVIISEETGKVSVAKDSKIIEVPDDIVLARMLKEHIGLEPEEEHRFFNKEKLKLWLAAFISLITVSIVWYGLELAQK